MPEEIPTPTPILKPADHDDLWEAFKHIIMFIAMGVYLIATVYLLHSFVDSWLPEQISNLPNIYGRSSFSMEKIYIAAIIVSYPIFISLFLLITKNTLKNPEIKNFRIRKTLIYLTLISVFVNILFNLVKIIVDLLNGKISANTLVHFLIPVTVSSIVFTYFIREARNKTI